VLETGFWHMNSVTKGITLKNIIKINFRFKFGTLTNCCINNWNTV